MSLWPLFLKEKLRSKEGLPHWITTWQIMLKTLTPIGNQEYFMPVKFLDHLPSSCGAKVECLPIDIYAFVHPSLFLPNKWLKLLQNSKSIQNLITSILADIFIANLTLNYIHKFIESVWKCVKMKKYEKTPKTHQDVIFRFLEKKHKTLITHPCRSLRCISFSVHAAVSQEILKQGYRLWPTLPCLGLSPDPIRRKNKNLAESIGYLLFLHFH